ncbi:MAG TPA: CBS domain-containing protein [Steroidobacteraceae bacterium]|nr:CBS domain-containing protein [Steroidobacteraceae bacterium]
MNVGDICSRGAIHVTESASLRDVAQLMQEHRVGAVVVTRPGPQPIATGIITDRDIVRAQLEHVADLSRLRVADVMTPSPFTLRHDETVEDAVEQMREHNVRRAPVVTPQGSLVGLVSADDLVTEAARELDALSRLLSGRQGAGGRQ